MKPSNPHDTYFSIDADGNLRTWVLVKGNHWAPDFQAIPHICDLPVIRGEYGVCSNNSICSCLPGFLPRGVFEPGSDGGGCAPTADGFTLCDSGKQQKFLRFTGYDYVFNQYAAALKITEAACEAKCLQNCSCWVYFYDANKLKGLCYVYNEVHTLKSVSDKNKIAALKV